MMANKPEVKDGSLPGDTSMEKKRRKRHKKLALDVCQQIEFYFSDANLRKDRFLKQEMAKSKDGYISVDIIANFNKLLSMTEDRKMVISAIQLSAILKLSEDQLFVKRRKTLKPPKYDPDDCTVYVECLPKKADHDLLRKAFSYCGKVVYVSLPRYKSTSDIKGFAFIEFETPEEADQACELMNNPPPDMMDRAGKFPKMRGNKRIVPLEFDQSKGHLSRNPQMRVPDRGSEDFKTDYRVGAVTEHGTKKAGGTNMTGSVGDDQGTKKRKRQFEDGEADSDGNKRLKDSSSDKSFEKKKRNVVVESSESSDSQKGLKRKRLEEPSSGGRTSARESTSLSESCGNEEEEGRAQMPKTLREAKIKMMQRKRSFSEGDIWSVREQEEDEDEDSDQGNMMIKKRRGNEAEDAKKQGTKDEEGLEKKKRMRKKKMRKIQEDEEALFLRVISKREWLLLKDEYLTLQKESLAQMKQTKRMHYPMPIFRRGTQTKSQVPASDTPQPKEPEVPLQSKMNEPVFTEGTVMKLECLQPSVSRKEAKEHLQTISPVAYVDLPEGHTQGFVRFETADGPKVVLEETNVVHLASEHISLSLVTGVEEKAYWEKLSRDRQIKLGSKQKKKKKRGVTKTAGQRATKEKAHIRFDA
eukprot:XP_011667560.1 PREDICTED: la-related protein 7 isoform X3 [Strongylocentrotus purpuratus]